MSLGAGLLDVSGRQELGVAPISFREPVVNRWGAQDESVAGIAKRSRDVSARFKVLLISIMFSFGACQNNFVWAQARPGNEQNAIAGKIVESAKKSLGQKMWTGYGLKVGTLGCAAAVSNVLKQAGVKDAHSAGVVVMRNQLMHGSRKFKEIILKDGSKAPLSDELLLRESRAGDILLAFAEAPSKPNLGGNAHCGIMSDGTYVFTNDWNDGIWKRVDIHSMFDYYQYVRLIRLLP